MIPYKDLNPSHRLAWMTLILISLNIAAFFYEILLPEPMIDAFIYRFAVVPKKIHVLPLFTAMFLHGGWLHLIGNMLYLWIFGDNVEERMGSFRFLAFYLLCGLIATAAQLYANPRSPLPILGASGAIAGVLAAYLRLFPRAQIAVLIPIFYFFRTIILPAWLILGMWVLLQVVQVQASTAHVGETGGVAYFAHIGGFFAGLLLMSFFTKKKRR